MCTLNITLSDALMERIRPAFPSQQAIQAYAQKQLEVLFVQYAEQLTAAGEHDLSARHNHEELCGIFSVSSDETNLRDEYIKDKYGL